MTRHLRVLTFGLIALSAVAHIKHREELGNGLGFVQLDVAVVRLPRISNFTDLDPFRVEPGVLTLYAVQSKRDPTQVRLFEMYADSSAYDSHIASAHFRKYKVGTQAMVKSLVLHETDPIALRTKRSDVLAAYGVESNQ